MWKYEADGEEEGGGEARPGDERQVVRGLAVRLAAHLVLDQDRLLEADRPADRRQAGQCVVRSGVAVRVIHCHKKKTIVMDELKGRQFYKIWYYALHK